MQQPFPVCSARSDSLHIVWRCLIGCIEPVLRNAVTWDWSPVTEWPDCHRDICTLSWWAAPPTLWPPAHVLWCHHQSSSGDNLRWPGVTQLELQKDTIEAETEGQDRLNNWQAACIRQWPVSCSNSDPNWVFGWQQKSLWRVDYWA